MIAAVVAWDAVEFAGGYNAFPLVIGFLPASFFLFALASFASLTAAIVILVAAFRRHIRYAILFSCLVAASWIFSPWFLARSAFLLGLATRLHHLSNPAEIQSVAQTCLSALPSGGLVFGPRKMMGPRPEEAEESQRVWKSISSSSFIHLDGDTCVVSVRPPEVSFTWGGALPGHWGIRVNAPQGDTRGYYFQTIRFGDNIILFRGE